MKFLAKTLVGCALCAVSALTSLSLAAPNNAAVVYFTLLHNREGGDTNGVGNTQRVAQAIAAQTNSQLMEIKVAKLYPSDYDETVVNDDVDRCADEIYRLIQEHQHT